MSGKSSCSPARPQYGALVDLVAQPTDAVIVDPAFAGALLLTSQPRADRPPVIVAGVLPLTLSSAAVPPFGLGLQPLRNLALNRARNAALRLLVERAIFGPVQREADAMFREVHGRPLRTFVLDWVSTVDAIAQLSVPAFEYPRPDASVPLHFVGPRPRPATNRRRRGGANSMARYRSCSSHRGPSRTATSTSWSDPPSTHSPRRTSSS